MKDLVFGVIFIALAISVWLMAQEFPVVPGMPYGADLFPTMIAIGMAIGGTVLSFQAVRQLRAESQTSKLTFGFSLPSVGILLPCVLVVAYIYLSEIVGAASMMLLIMLTLLIFRGVRLRHAVGISVVATAVISLSFSYVLNVPLPIGPLGF